MIVNRGEGQIGAAFHAFENEFWQLYFILGLFLNHVSSFLDIFDPSHFVDHFTLK